MSGIRTRARGELESEVLRILRESEVPLSAKDLQDHFTGAVPAYTTLLTALDRLVVKGEVGRIADSPRKVRFSATRSAAENVSDSMIGALGRVEDRRAALLKFAGNLDDEDVLFLQQSLESRGRSGKRNGSA